MLVFVKRLMAHIQKETEQPEIFDQILMMSVIKDSHSLLLFYSSRFFEFY
jgi:hypothetical protein